MVKIVNGHDLDTQSGRADFRAAGGWVEGNDSGGYSYEGGGTSGSGGGSQTPTQGATFNSGGGTSSPGTTTSGQPMGADYAASIQKISDALAAGNREAFNRAVYEWDQTFGFDKEKFAEDTRRFNEQFQVTQAGLSGMYQDAPTLPALTSYANQFGLWGVPTAGQQTLAAQNQYFTQGLAGISQAAGMQANPFRQQQVLGQLGGLYSGQGVAGFQAPNVVQGVGTAGGNNRGGMGYLQQMIDDIRDPTPNQTNMNQVLNATPTPNKLNSVDFLRAAPSTQNMVLQAMNEKYGIDPGDAVKQIQNTLPAFQAPSAMGGVRR